MISGLLKDLQDLVRGEVALAKAEIKEDVSTAGKGVAAMATAAFFGLTGFIFLMLGLTYLLNIWMRMWIAATIVGVLLVVIAAVLGMSGKKKLSASSLKPEQTIDSLKEDQQWAKAQISSVKK
jgi:cell division protein FtsW (lipid II flippase)